MPLGQVIQARSQDISQGGLREGLIMGARVVESKKKHRILKNYPKK